MMLVGDRLLVPGLNVHFRFGSDFAAASSFGFGLGGFSSTAKTRRLSRSESSRCSASWITALAALKLCWRTKSVKSVRRSAAARRRSAFSSAGIRSDIRLLSSIASLGVARLLSIVHIQIVHNPFSPVKLCVLIAHRRTNIRPDCSYILEKYWQNRFRSNKKQRDWDDL